MVAVKGTDFTPWQEAIVYESNNYQVGTGRGIKERCHFVVITFSFRFRFFYLFVLTHFIICLPFASPYLLTGAIFMKTQCFFLFSGWLVLSCAHSMPDVTEAYPTEVEGQLENHRGSEKEGADSLSSCTNFTCDEGSLYTCKLVEGRLLKKNSLVITQKYPNFVEEYCYQDKIENKNGKYISWFPNGAMESMGGYRNNLKTGEWSFWYVNGVLEGNGTFSENKMNGEWNFYYTDGVKQYKQINFYEGDTKEYVSLLDRSGLEISKYKIRGNKTYEIEGKSLTSSTQVTVISFLLEHNNTISNNQRW